LSGCVSSGRPWIPPKETAQAEQAWEKSTKPELKREWIFIDEQFVEVKDSVPPNSSDSDSGKLLIQDSFKPQPQEFLGESEIIPRAAQGEKEEYRWSAYYFIYSTIPFKKDNWWHIKIGNLSRSKDVWSKQVENQQSLRVSCNDKEVDKVEVRTKGRFTRAKLNQEPDPSESGLPSLRKLVEDLTSWICLKNINPSAP
jgi:hypothetical protein